MFCFSLYHTQPSLNRYQHYYTRIPNTYTYNFHHLNQPLNMSNNNDSTLKSYIDSATGTVQSAFGSVMGSTGDKVSPLDIVYF